jgi:hypothetical protein
VGFMMFYLTLRIQADLSENSENRIPANPMVAHHVLNKIALLEVYPCTWLFSDKPTYLLRDCLGSSHLRRFQNPTCSTHKGLFMFVHMHGFFAPHFSLFVVFWPNHHLPFLITSAVLFGPVLTRDFV